MITLSQSILFMAVRSLMERNKFFYHSNSISGLVIGLHRCNWNDLISSVIKAIESKKSNQFSFTVKHQGNKHKLCNTVDT